jgi:hypothetical protein
MRRRESPAEKEETVWAVGKRVGGRKGLLARVGVDQVYDNRIALQSLFPEREGRLLTVRVLVIKHIVNSL